MRRGWASKGRRRGVFAFMLAAAAVVFAMAWLSLAFVRVDHGARTDALHQEAVRLALWRADSWVAPLLASEAAREPLEYRAFPRGVHPLEPHVQLEPSFEFGSPSPLMGLVVPYVELWFEIDEAGRWTSPQVPEGRGREYAAELGALSPDEELLSARLELVRGLLDLEGVREETGASVEEFERQIGGNFNVANALAPDADEVMPEGAQDVQKSRNFIEHKLRAQTGYKAQWIAQNAFDNNQGLLETMVDAPRVGPFLPYCLRPGHADPLVLFLRSAVLDGRPRVQGFLADWEAVQVDLLEQVVDLFESVAIETIDPGRDVLGDRDYATQLASLPARLAAGPTRERTAVIGEGTRTTLAVAWIAALAALAGLGFALRASTLYAERKSRFASAVTHELRTPLTTFRMYSEMLAGDMVRGEEERRSYLATLVQESERLGRLVENVLTWARVEEGRRPPRRERTSVRALLDRVGPALERRAMQAGALLDIELEPGAGERELETDVEAAGQILFNLVDKACKYGRTADGECQVHVGVALAGSDLAFRVRDEGPGISAREQGRIFRSFERGAEGERDPNSGVGLGLALSAGLAQELGGRLELEPGQGGASFRLDLPAG